MAFHATAFKFSQGDRVETIDHNVLCIHKGIVHTSVRKQDGTTRVLVEIDGPSRDTRFVIYEERELKKIPSAKFQRGNLVFHRESLAYLQVDAIMTAHKGQATVYLLENIDGMNFMCNRDDLMRHLTPHEVTAWRSAHEMKKKMQARHDRPRQFSVSRVLSDFPLT